MKWIYFIVKQIFAGLSSSASSVLLYEQNNTIANEKCKSTNEKFIYL